MVVETIFNNFQHYSSVLGSILSLLGVSITYSAMYSKIFKMETSNYRQFSKLSTFYSRIVENYENRV